MNYLRGLTFAVVSAALLPLAGCASTDSMSTRFNAANDTRPFDHRYDATKVPDAKYPDPGFYDERTAHWNAMYQHFEK